MGMSDCLHKKFKNLYLLVGNEGRTNYLRRAVVLSTQRWRSDLSSRKKRNDIADPGLPKGMKTVADMPGGRSQLNVLLRLMMSKGGIQKSILKMQTDSVKRNGTIMKGSASSGRDIFIADPDAVAKVYRSESLCPFRSPSLPIRLFYAENPSVKPGLLFGNGDNWYKPKQILSKRLLKPLAVNGYIPRLREIAIQSIARLSRLCLPEEHERRYEVTDLDQELFKWSFESVTSVLFDKRLNTLQDNPPAKSLEFINSVHTFLACVGQCSLYPGFMFKIYKPKLYRQMCAASLSIHEIITRMFEEYVEELHFDGNDDDVRKLIPFMLSSGELTEETIIASIKDTLFAGVDSTSNTLLWVLYLLAKHQQQQTRLRKEILKVFSEYEEIDERAIEKMPYLRAVIKETMRLYPIVIIHGRTLSSDIIVGNYVVPKKTKVNFLHWAMGRSAEYFPDPEVFKPERWLRDEAETTPSKFASAPFGHGLRMCLGRRVATLELNLFLSYLLKGFRLEYPEGKVVEPFYRSALAPDRPLRVKFLAD